MANNILHTHSGYAHHNIDTSFIQRLGSKDSQSSARAMEQKEQQLYKQFGVGTFEDFRNLLTTLFLPEDKKVLKRFEAENLAKELQQFSIQQRDLYEQQVELRFNFSKLDHLHSIGQMLGFKANSKADDKIRITYGVEEIKRVINKQFGRHFHTKSEFEKNIDGFVHQLLTSGVLEIGISNGKSEDYSETYAVHKIPNFPWGVTKDVYEAAKREGNLAILDEIERATKEIYLFIVNNLGAQGSADMKQAIRNTWLNLCRGGSDPQLFFSGGKTSSFISGVQGAMGEFQTALMFEYLGLKIGVNTLSVIKGSTRLDNLTKEQARTDVEIFKTLGFQVKNFVTIEKDVEGGKYKSFLQDIKTRTHPDMLARYFNPDVADGFLAYMANIYFNESYYQEEYIKTTGLIFALQEWVAEIMNMAVVDGVGDTVTFYIIGGKYLVPCSIILRASDKINLKNSLTIQSSFKRKTNEQFSQTNSEGKPEYKKYWTKDKGYWEATEANKQQFKNLISSTISIQTSFNFFDEIEKYAIW